MRYLKLILAALLLLCTLNVTASADSAAVITTAEELAAMDFNGNYVLGNDIHLTGQWQPIYFAGSLDGQGHTITGLNINCTTEPNVGLFSWLDGTVSNLNIRDARITASYPDGCNASIIGTCPDAWQFDPLSSQYHVFNCNVSGTINVYGSGIVGGSGLIGAQNSTADVTINVEGSNFMSPALWGTRNCEIKGTMNITDNGGGYGEVGAVLNSFGSQSELNINVTNANPNNTEVYVYGVYGRSDVRSNSCVVSGDISSPGHASAISNSDNCEYTGTITSDNITGLFNCTGCYLGGTMKNSGERTAAKANFLADLTTDDPEEKSSNELALEYTFSDYGVTKILDIFNNIRPGCTLDIDMDITSGAAGVSINSDFMAPEGYEKHVYEQGDIQVTTTTGYISIYRNTATTGRVYLYSDSGDITVTAGKYNTGDVTAYSAGNMHVVGASLYNSGSIHVTGPGYGTAIGVYGENALNEGFIIAECASEGDISAIGAGGL